MGTGPLGGASSAAGVPAAGQQANTDNSQVERARQSARAERDRFAQRREEEVDDTEQDQSRIGERSGDGQNPYTPTRQRGAAADESEEQSDNPAETPTPDASDERGHNVDLSA